MKLVVEPTAASPGPFVITCTSVDRINFEYFFMNVL